ncbi:MAG: sigma-70 family RNA polymerase sigma factor [Planctomycetales bacterium]|nr:sigma-70 family RNA polymerase sigma factor [Planctomycetales bacterium]
MHDVTQILRKIESGDRQAADELLPVVYDALRRLAASRMKSESPDHTLQPTALVHEAYVRLVKAEDTPSWESRGHFFAAAAEAMRRILVDHARSKMTLKRGADFQRIDLLEVVQDGKIGDAELLVLDDALREFETLEPEKARIVKLKFFAGMTLNEAAESTGLSRATAQRHWTYARAWLYGKLKESYDGEDSMGFSENR